MTIAPIDPTDDQAEPTVEKPAAVSPNIAPESTALQEQPAADDSTADDDIPPLEPIDETPRRKRRRKSIRLAGLWWQIGCWKIGQTYRRFPGWTAATFAGGIAVILSLMLLANHVFSPPAAILNEAAELGEPTDDGFFNDQPADNDDGPSPVPFASRSADEPDEELTAELDMDVSAYLLSDDGSFDELFTVSAQDIPLADDAERVWADNFAATDALWRPYDSFRASDPFEAADDLTSSADGGIAGDPPGNRDEDVISASKDAVTDDDDLWKGVDGTRSRPASSEESSALVETQVDAPHLKLTWALPENIYAGKLFVVDFEIENIGVLPVDEVRIEADLGEGLTHRYGPRIMYKVGALLSGQKYKCQMFLTAKEAGEFEQQVRLTGSGSLFQQESLSFDVGTPSTATEPTGRTRR